MSYGIDPLLFKSYENPLEQKAELLKNKMGEKKILPEEEAKFLKNFKDEIRKNLSPEANSKISSNQLQRNLTRSQIKQVIEKDPSKKGLYEAALQFESFFIEKMFAEMKKNVPKDSLIDGGRAEEIFDEMLLTERVKAMNHQMEFGMAEMMYQQLQGL